jgi:tRNA(Ile)-lysidine synthase
VATPLTLEELAAAFDAIGGFEARPIIALAVSGGPDSLALTMLADRWARQRGGEAWGLHVNHRLRPESDAEAGIVAGWLASRGIRHRLLVWEGTKPATGVQEAARRARYRLLSEWCRAHGCLHLLTAHHRDDQIETHLIRRRAQSGPDGLAGMAAVRELAGLRLVRPLLGVARARLAAFLEAERQDFLSDPSNRNPRFERARLRLSLAGRTDPVTSDKIAAYGRRRAERERQVGTLLARTVAVHPAGFASVQFGAIAHQDSDLAERLLARVVACIGGSPYPPRRERVQRLRTSLAQAPHQGRTLAGCRVIPWRGVFLVVRELAAASPAAIVGSGEAMLWDRRFQVTSAMEAQCAYTIGYLGSAASAVASGDLAGDLPHLIRPSLLALWDRDGIAAVPHLGYRREDAAGLPCVSFRPANPLTQAGFTVV